MIKIVAAFILGLSLGIGFGLWRQRKLNSRLRQVLTSLSDNKTDTVALPMVYQVRQEISRSYQQRLELKAEIQEWQHLLNSAPVGYLQVDEENRLLWCNLQAQKLLKIDRWQPGQLRLILELVRSYELDRLIEQTRISQKSHTREWVFHTTNYQKQNPLQTSLSVRGFSLPLPQKQVGIFIENRQHLAELERSRDRSFSDLAHELRTPLTSVSLVAEALQTRLQGIELSWVEQMLTESNRLMQLVQDYLEVSNLAENPYQKLVKSPLVLKDLVFYAWQILEPIAQKKQIKIAYSEVKSISLEADKSRLTQIFINLLDNGIKNSPAGEVIRVEVKTITPTSPEPLPILEKDTLETDVFVQINIIDAGSGFSESDLPYVFERLYRGDISRKRQDSDYQNLAALPISSGSGLGLSIVQEIVKAHNGSIQAKNHPQTGGGWLQIQLPLMGNFNSG